MIILIKWGLIGLPPLWLALAWCFPVVWSLMYLLLFSLLLAIAVFVLTLWGHVALSSPHQNSLFLLDRVEKEVRQLEESLKVRNILENQYYT